MANELKGIINIRNSSAELKIRRFSYEEIDKLKGYYMKLQTEQREVERSANFVENLSSIKITPKAYDVLASGIYTDNIAAIIRELSTNAYDSHVVAGNSDTPFIVHLPTKLEPWFSVKDFGTGLADDEVRRLWLHFFETTKDQTNDAAGVLGLGAKSPLSYTRAFEVISRFNGTRSTYSVFFNENNIPAIAKLAAADTDERNGIEVKVPVKSQDLVAFRTKAQYVLMWFPTTPTISNVPDFVPHSLPSAVWSANDGSWELYDKKDTISELPTFVAIQGPVAYKVDTNQLNLDKQILSLLRRFKIVTRHNIGDFDFAVSREEVKYTDRTVKLLTSKVHDIIKTIVSDVEAVTDSNSRWTSIANILDVANGKLGMNNNDFTIALQHVINAGIVNTSNNMLLSLITDGPVIKLEEIKNNHPAYDMWWYSAGVSSYSKALSSRKKAKTVVINSRASVAFNDVPSGGVTRLKDYHANKDTRGMLMIVLASGAKKTWTDEQLAFQLKSLTDQLGNPPVVVASVDTKPSANSGTQKGTHLRSIYKLTDMTAYRKRYNTIRYTCEWKKAVDFSIDTGGLYFYLEQGKYVLSPGYNRVAWLSHNPKVGLTDVVKIINAVMGTHYTTENVVGIGKREWNTFDEHPKWINLFDMLRDVISEYKHVVMFYKSQIHKYSSTLDIVSEVFRRNNDILEEIKKLPNHSLFKQQIIETWDFYCKTNELMEFMPSLIKLMQYCPVDANNTTTQTYPSVDMHQLSNRYPMIGLLSTLNGLTYDRWKILLDYVNNIDTRSQQ